MKLTLFDYILPEKLIAQTPAEPRDHSRLLVYNRKKKQIKHDYFYNLPKYLRPTDLLIFNDTKVFPARLIGNKKDTGGRAEILLLKHIEGSKWEVIIGAKRPKIGLKMRFKQGLEAEVIDNGDERTWIVKFNFSGADFFQILDKIGQVPLPPYIHSLEKQSKLKKQYQTIYANEIGSAAAPTAGLHFTKELFKQIKKVGCDIDYVTLHVGLGTFSPVNTEKIEDFKIHEESIAIKKEVIDKILKAKKEKRRVIAVGTTSVRVLESVFNLEKLPNKDYFGSTKIFIYPGYKFKAINGMITNFHLPKSSLLMLVSAFIGRARTMEIYNKAIKLKYGFFSFGDGMFIS